MHLLLLPALLLAAPPDDAHAPPKPPLELGRSGIVAHQYFAGKGVEKYAGGVAPRREDGPNAEYADVLEHAGARSTVKVRLRARVEKGAAVVEATASASIATPSADFANEGFGQASPQVWAAFTVNALPTQGLVMRVEGTTTAAGATAETSVDLLVDGREVETLQQVRELRRRIEVPLSPGEHTVWVETRATTGLQPGRPAAADAALTAVVRLTLEELPAPKPPARARCEKKGLRFPASPRIDDGKGHVTHLWPNDSTLGVVQSRTPVFLVRVDQRVDPEEILSQVAVTDGSWHSWRAPRLRLLACFEEAAGERAFTTVVFQPVAPFPLMESHAQWILRPGSLLEPLGGQRFHPLSRALSGGPGVGGMVVVEGPGRSVGTPTEADGASYLLDTVRLSPELVAAELKNDRDALELLRDWAKLDVKGALEAVKEHEQTQAARATKAAPPLATGTECGEDRPAAPARRPSPGLRPTSPRRRRERYLTARRSPR